MQEDCQISGILQSGNRLIELLGHESVLNSRKRKNDSEKNVTDTQSRGDSSKDAENKTQTMDYSQVFPYWDFFSLVLDLLWTSGLIIPSNSSKQKCLSHHCVLEARSVFSSFIGPQMQRNYDPGSHIPKSHPYLIQMMVLGTLCVNQIFFSFCLELIKLMSCVGRNISLTKTRYH